VKATTLQVDASWPGIAVEDGVASLAYVTAIHVFDLIRD